MPITDNCQKLKQKRYRKKPDESIHTWKTKGDQTKTKNKNEKQTKKEKAKGNYLSPDSFKPQWSFTWLADSKEWWCHDSDLWSTGRILC